MGTSVIAGFLRAFWREISIVGLLSGFWLFFQFIHSPQIENLNLKLQIAEANLSQCERAFTNQSERIIEESENTAKIVIERFDRLELILSKLSDEEDEQIKDILDQEVPDSCEELNDFLIDMVDRLGW